MLRQQHAQPGLPRRRIDWCATARGSGIPCPVPRRGRTFGHMRESIYQAAGGRRAFMALAEAWHARCLADPVMSHPFSHGVHPRHAERLAAYWAEALGGPTEYTDGMGDQSSVVRMHSGNGEHPDMDGRAVELFKLAMEDAGLPPDPKLRESLVSYFRWAIDLMNAHPHSPESVTPGLPMARWTWDGPVNATK